MHFSVFSATLTLGIGFLVPTPAAGEYILNPGDVYQGSSFFDKFDFFTDKDPTAGFVDYQTQTAASSKVFGGQLVWNTSTQAYLGVDHWNKIRTDGSVRGRPSVRLESKKTYQYGLFLLDLAHMPANVCGTWPAFWTTSHIDYPRWGEIDILENVHEQNSSLATLHTAADCTVAGNKISNQMTGSENSYNCDDQATTSPYGSQSVDQGCSAVNNVPNTYGTNMNAAGGGVYAMEWTPNFIRMWSFERKNIPNDILVGKPQPSTWIEPVFTTAQGSCNIDAHFKDHHVIFDTTFCGNWAGQDYFWQQTSCYNNNKDGSGNYLYPSCNQYVAANPNAYAEAYWLINSLKVYQQSNATENIDIKEAREEATSPTLTRTFLRTTSKSFRRITKRSSGSTNVTGSVLPPYVNHTTTAIATTSATQVIISKIYYENIYKTITSCAPNTTSCSLGGVITESVPFFTYTYIAGGSGDVTGSADSVYTLSTQNNRPAAATFSVKSAAISSTIPPTPTPTITSDTISFIPETYTFCWNDLGVSSCTIETITSQHKPNILPLYELTTLNHAPGPPAVTVTRAAPNGGANSVHIYSIKTEIQQLPTASPIATEASPTLTDVPATTYYEVVEETVTSCAPNSPDCTIGNVITSLDPFLTLTLTFQPISTLSPASPTQSPLCIFQLGQPAEPCDWRGNRGGPPVILESETDAPTAPSYPNSEVPYSVVTSLPDITTISLAELNRPTTTLITNTVGTSTRVFTVVLVPAAPIPSATAFSAPVYGINGGNEQIGEVLSTTHITSVSGTVTTIFTITVKPNPETLISGSYVEGGVYTTEVTSIIGSVTDVFTITVAPRPVVSGSYVGGESYITIGGSSSFGSGGSDGAGGTSLTKILAAPSKELGTSTRPMVTETIAPTTHNGASSLKNIEESCLLVFAVSMVAMMFL